MNETKLEQQLVRERAQVSLGIERYYKHIEDMALSGTQVGTDLSFRGVGRTADAITEFVRNHEEGKAGVGKPLVVVPYLQMLDPVPTAYITVRCCINGIAGGERVQTIAMRIATQIKEHLDNDALFAEAPALGRSMEVKAKKWTKAAARRFIMRLGVKVAGVSGLEWNHGDRLRVGMKLIELLIGSAGLCYKKLISQGADNRMTVLRATPMVEQWLAERHVDMSVRSPRYNPMVVPPVPWTSPISGGYLTPANQLKFIGGINAEDHRELRDDLLSADLTDVYDALNTAQATGWRVNRDVYDVLVTLWKDESELAGLPPNKDELMPTRPADIPENLPYEKMSDSQKEKIHAYSSAKKKAHDLNAVYTSRRIAISRKVSMTSELKDEPVFYFPYNLDFRGRLYSVVDGIDPQGDDVGKALIEFAEGKPLGERGAMWLMVHIANLFGEDKCSFEDRVEWTDKHHDLIIDSATNPLDGERFWCTADYPFCALAACIEYAEANESGNASEYVSHLPIAMDGSCSGIQHFSAMLRDKDGGSEVNLTKRDDPADIYNEVARRTEELIANSGKPELNCWAGKVTRKIVKRPCMTFAYSVTARGMRDQILDEINKESGADNYLPGVENYEAANLLSVVVDEAIRDTVTRASEAMKWLQETTRVYFKELTKRQPGGKWESALPINWSTPDGLPVQHRYKVMNAKRYKVWFDGQRMDVQLRVPSDRPDLRKQASSVSPNFVHSMDASHLRMVVNRLVREGVTTSFSLIHDSFGVHACDVDDMHHVIRDEFIRMYSTDILEEFLNDQIKSVGDEGVDWPTLPKKGSLNLEEVRDADFFFA